MPELKTRLASALGDRYRLIRELSGGGMSRVFLAEELALNRDVVVKVLSPDLVGPQHVERFRQEIQQTARLQHPSIVPVLAVGTVDYEAGTGGPYYIMPYIRGETLRSRLEREGPFSSSTLVRVLRDILEALIHAHRHGVIHRDIKPENVFIAGGHAVVTDFGIAKALTARVTQESLTLPGLAIGTPAYMAPEQAGGGEDLDGRTDLYSVGVVAYELLTGKVPFAGMSTRQILAAQVRSSPAPIQAARPDLPPALSSAIMKCLEREPADRWASADELLRVLEGIRLSDPGVASGTHTAEGPAPSPILHRFIPWVLALAALVVAIGWATRALIPAPLEGSAGEPALAVLQPLVEGDTSGLPMPATAFQRDFQWDLTRRLQEPGQVRVLDYTAVRDLDSAQDQRRTAGRWNVGQVIASTLRTVPGRGVELEVRLLDGATWGVLRQARLGAGLKMDYSVLLRTAVDSLGAWLGLPRPAEEIAVKPRSPKLTALRDRAEVEMRKRTAAGFNAAIELYQEALVLDGADSWTHARLSNLYSLQIVYLYADAMGPYEAAAHSLAHARRAVALDSNSAFANMALGYILNQAGGPVTEARASFDRALRRNREVEPGWYSVLLLREGRKAEALEMAERGVSQDPANPGRRLSVAWDAIGFGEYRLAIAAADSALRIDASLDLAKGLLVRGLLLDGAIPRCIATDVGPYIGTKAACLEDAGRQAEATALVDSLLHLYAADRTARRFDPALYAQELAIYYAWLGERHAALQWAREAFHHTPNGIPYPFLQSGLFAKIVRDKFTMAVLDGMAGSAYERVRLESTRIPAGGPGPTPR